MKIVAERLIQGARVGDRRVKHIASLHRLLLRARGPTGEMGDRA